MEAYIGALIGGLIFGLLIWVISKLNIGLRIDGYLWAVTLGFLISAWNRFVFELLPDANIFVSALIGVLATAVIIFLVARFFKQIETRGFMGALAAAIAIGVAELIIAALLLEVA